MVTASAATLDLDQAVERARSATDPVGFRLAADHLIAVLAEGMSLPPQKRSAVFQQLLQAILRGQALYRPKPNDDLSDVIGRQDTPLEARQFWAIALLRAGAHSDIFKDNTPLRLKTVKLAEESLGQNVLKRMQWEESRPTHEKLELLFSLVRQFESDLKSLRVTSLKDLPEVRQKLYRLMNQAWSKPFVVTFATLELIDDLISLVNAASDWADDQRSWSVHSLEALASRRDDLSETASKVGTQYATLLVSVAGQVIDVLQAAFATSPASKPPTVSIAASDKKYPLHSPGLETWFCFDVLNAGPGDALEVSLEVVDATSVACDEPTAYLGRLEANSKRRAEIAARVLEPADSVMVELKASWRTSQGAVEHHREMLELSAQSASINWGELEVKDPYSSEPVTTDEELVGRSTILNELYARAMNDRIGSSYVWGQKRVGKTSIVKTLATRLRREVDDLTIVDLEAGTFGEPSPAETVTRLGKLICQDLSRQVPALRHIPVPEFGNSLSPLVDFLRTAKNVAPNFRVLIILDEFDEIPSALYRRTLEGNQFFLALRAISGLGYCGIILVGGEKMEYVINYQGDKLNKFKQFRVDYFNSQNQWQDYLELARKPVEGYLEISDEAIHVLFEYASGNPYFTKLVGQQMVALCLERRDAFVSDVEMRLAAQRTIEQLGPNAFQHFWEDGIPEEGQAHEEVSLTRKRALVSIASKLRPDGSFDAESLIAEGFTADLPPETLRREIVDFKRRGVLEERDGQHRVRLMLFSAWLRGGGASQLILSRPREELARELSDFAAVNRISPSQILDLTSKWGIYRGKRIGEEHVRAWLDQFEDGEERRIAFELAKHVRFYKDAEVRQRMKDAYQFIERNSPGLRLTDLSRKRKEFLVSYLNGPGKSGTRYGKLFADENNIYADSVVEFSAISREVAANRDAQVLVFLDDVTGSGQSLKKGITQLIDEHGEALRGRGIRVFVIYITGFLESVLDVEEVGRAHNLDVRVSICDPLQERDKCFSPESTVFPNEEKRERAKELALKYGKRLFPQHPLGYGGSELLITFESNCPNNSLPILWSSSKDWRPLFER